MEIVETLELLKYIVQKTRKKMLAWFFFKNRMEIFQVENRKEQNSGSSFKKNKNRRRREG